MNHTNHHKESNIEVRQMEIGDLADVFHLGERLFTADKWPALYRTWDEFEVVSFYASDTDTCFVATRDDKVVGFALGNIIEKEKKSVTPVEISQEEQTKLLKAGEGNTTIDISYEGKQYQTRVAGIHMDEANKDIDEIELAVVS